MLKPIIRDLLAAENLDAAAVIPFSACHVWQAEKLSYYGLTEETAKSVFIVLVPYYVGEFPGRKISLYAVGRDYHVYFRAYFARMCEALQKAFPGFRFGGSADNSPIDERHAALTAGLGKLGDNGLIIHPDYGTYVFIGEIISDMPAGEWYEDPAEVTVSAIEPCEHCGACGRACPMKKGNNPYGITECLSAVNQTKRLEDEPDKRDYFRYFSAAWGCDRCQSACPHNRAPKITPVTFWHEALKPYPTADEVEAMPDEVFSERAYAWRGRKTILRNLRLIEEDEKNGGLSYEKTETILSLMREAGDIMRRAHDVEAEDDSISVKPGSANFVTVYDVRVQTYLMEHLREAFPDAAFLAEEQEHGGGLPEHGYCFIIDPIDGTTNFIHDYGTSCISVGLLYDGVPVFGAVWDPYRGEMFHARKGLGSFLNGKRIRVSDRPAEKALFAVGTTPYYKDTLADRSFSAMRVLFDAGADIRRFGSAALDLAAVACGRADGYCELKISPWDYAAGALLVTEAGGFVCRADGKELGFSEPCGVIAGTAETREILLRASKDRK